MKKLLTFLMTAFVCFGLFTPVSVGATEERTDERTGITYSIYYRTSISCSANGHDEGNTQIQAFPEYQVYNFDTSLDSSEVVAGIAKMEAKITDTFDTLVSNRGILDQRSLMDGYEYTVPDSSDHYWRFFDLPRDFKGTTVITRGDVPFTVTADGQGKLSFKVVTDCVGEKYAEFYIPTEVSHTKTVTKTEKYYLHHPGFEKGPYNTLDEALDYCSKYASAINPSKPIQIEVDGSYYSQFFVTITSYCKLQVTYGNTPTRATMDKKTESKVSSTVASNTQSTTVSKSSTKTPADTTDFSQTGTTANISSTASNVSSTASDKPSNMAAVWITITAVILLGAATSVIILLKRYKSE